MGNPFLLQGCLRLEERYIPENLELGVEYPFSKEGHRLYMIDVPVDLLSADWEFRARVIIPEYTVGRGKTHGTFIPVKKFTDEERAAISKAHVSDSELRSALRD